MVSSRVFADSNLDPRFRAGLVGHWLGGGSGLTWFDRSGCGNHGAINGAAWTLGEGGHRYALALDGVDDHVVVPHSENWNLPDMSVVIRLRFRVVANAMFVQHKSGATFGGFEFDYQAGPGYIVWCPNAAVIVSATWAPQADRWYQVAFTRDGASNLTVIYVDGMAIGSGTLATDTAVVTGDLLIGAWSSAGYNFNGVIAEVQVYSRALSAAEVATLASPSYSPIIGGGLICGL